MPGTEIITQDRDAIRLVASLIPDSSSDTAWRNYKGIIAALGRGRRVLEIGAGREPLFSPAELVELGMAYTANDILRDELSLISHDVAHACFDVASQVPPEFEEQFDVICSRMVQEHIRDDASFHANLHRLLAPGGVAVNFFPTLWHPVFLLNWILPDALAGRLLRLFFPHRNASQTPKFPAYYKGCTSLLARVDVLREHGFSAASVIPFYGQSYFRTTPGLGLVFRWLDGWAMKRDFRPLSAFAYSIVVK